MDLTAVTESVVRQKLIERGFVLVTDRWEDKDSRHMNFLLSNGTIVRVSDKDMVAGPPTVYRDACQAAGVIVEENLDRLVDLLRYVEAES